MSDFYWSKPDSFLVNQGIDSYPGHNKDKLLSTASSDSICELEHTTQPYIQAI